METGSMYPSTGYIVQTRNPDGTYYDRKVGWLRFWTTCIISRKHFRQSNVMHYRR